MAIAVAARREAMTLRQRADRESPKTSEIPPGPKSIDVELFAGAGGLSVGLRNAGLSPDHLFEVDPTCCDTLRTNAKGRWPLIEGQVHEADVGQVDWSSFSVQPTRLLSAGPPCQPFSLAGKHLAEKDDRNEFPALFRAVRALKPAAVLIENVHGLKRASFRPYLEYILRQLECPGVEPLPGELWDEHDARLRTEQAGQGYASEYRAEWGLLNAADFGVAQTRSRVIMIAWRSDLPIVALPQPTHSMSALVKAQEDGEYWRVRGLQSPKKPKKRRGAPGYAQDPERQRQPWRTVRDVLAGLEEPPPRQNHSDVHHWLIPGARIYPKHDGSELDWPSKTVKAGVHGVAGGENILRRSAKRFRYFTLRELARLQGFPDQYKFAGSRSRVINQIGNAVPCRLAEALAEGFKPALQAFERELARRRC